MIIGYLDALGHDYLDGTCTRCGEADPDYVKPVESPFPDVPADSFYAAPVLWALENGITTGTSDSTFYPTTSVFALTWSPSSGAPRILPSPAPPTTASPM